jgi:hypothetical protein
MGNIGDILSDFWIDNYCGKVTNPHTNEQMEYEHCVLCSSGPGKMNTGVIETPTSGKVWCVCPNGRAIARQLKSKGPK